VLSGALLSGCAGGSVPVAYYGQHGVGDTVLPIASGRQLRDHYVSVNGCKSMSPQEPASGSGTHIKTQYSNCSTGHPVTWIAFDGPHEPLASDRGKSEWTSDEVWSFFSQFASQ
jgi:poly(3-hydroxybutyrate) depolymerase